MASVTACISSEFGEITQWTDAVWFNYLLQCHWAEFEFKLIFASMTWEFDLTQLLCEFSQHWQRHERPREYCTELPFPGNCRPVTMPRFATSDIRVFSNRVSPKLCTSTVTITAISNIVFKPNSLLSRLVRQLYSSSWCWRLTNRQTQIRRTDQRHIAQTPIRTVVRFTMYFRSKFLESSEPIHFWNP